MFCHLRVFLDISSQLKMRTVRKASLISIEQLNYTIMRTLNVTTWSRNQDGSHMLHCVDDRFGTLFSVEIPARFQNCINYEQMSKGWLTLPEEYSIKLLC